MSGEPDVFTRIGYCRNFLNIPVSLGEWFPRTIGFHMVDVSSADKLSVATRVAKPKEATVGKPSRGPKPLTVRVPASRMSWFGYGTRPDQVGFGFDFGFDREVR